MVRGVAARAVSEFMKARQTEDAAARRVASVLGEKPATIKSWRKDILRLRPSSALAAQHYWVQLPPEMGDTPAQRAESLLLALKRQPNSLRTRNVA
jgi:hypothetical protein